MTRPFSGEWVEMQDDYSRVGNQVVFLSKQKKKLEKTASGNRTATFGEG